MKHRDIDMAPHCTGEHCAECRPRLLGKHRGPAEPRRPVDGIDQINSVCPGMHCAGRHFAVNHRGDLIPRHKMGRPYTGPPLYPYMFAAPPTGPRYGGIPAPTFYEGV